AAACSSPGASTAPTTAAATTPPAGTTTPATDAPPTAAAMTKVSVQLQWVSQAQFAGEIAAKAEGFYEAAGLDVTLLEGGPNVANITVGCATTGPEFTLGWVPKALVAVESGNCDLVSIAQIYQRSGTRSVSWKDSNITSVDQFKGKKIGVWDFGNEYEVTSGALKHGLTVGTDYTRVIQDFNMAALLNREIDVAEAMTYNEYAQVLEAKNPDTGNLYQPGDLNVIDWNAEGTAMLQDAVFARAAWLSQPGSEEIATKFLKATFEGWIFCRDNPDKCVEHVLAVGTTLGKGHQAWQMNEVNPLIWPSPNGIGITDKALWDQTIAVALQGKFLTKTPAEGAYRNDLAEAALAQISGDTKGTSFVKGTAVVTENGE
ncbi:MAG TPA: ABC transporter substrate-binding protein, partial [Candidatus Limnocylindria bacterium]|nr:ABC transporter substrate-binding protein [Candidatus Limnocylindria bacterium]